MHTEPDWADLEAKAHQIRRDIVTMIHAAGDGHPGPALSIVELVTALYFHVMRIDPARPQWPDRDRLVLGSAPMSWKCTLCALWTPPESMPSSKRPARRSPWKITALSADSAALLPK